MITAELLKTRVFRDVMLFRAALTEVETEHCIGKVRFQLTKNYRHVTGPSLRLLT